MYKPIKKAARIIFPKSILFRHESIFRYFHGLFFIGNTHECNVCNNKLRSFVLNVYGGKLCPFCGSLPKSRRLWYLLINSKLKGNVLHFSPSRCLYRKLKKMSHINYISSVFGGDFLGDENIDITNINFEDNQFDTIICYHILEHILNDKKAISELYRILKPHGSVIIQTPFKDGDIYEDYNIISPELKNKHFGQKDHVRIYSVEGLLQRLQSNGFKVEVLTFQKSDEDIYYGYTSPESILLAVKN